MNASCKGLLFVSRVGLGCDAVPSSSAPRRCPIVDLVDDDDDVSLDFGHRCKVVALVQTSSRSTHSKLSSAVCLWQNVFVRDNNWFSGSYTNLSLKMQLNSTIDLRIRYWTSLYVSLSLSLYISSVSETYCCSSVRLHTSRKHTRHTHTHTHFCARNARERKREWGTHSRAHTFVEQLLLTMLRYKPGGISLHFFFLSFISKLCYAPAENNKLPSCRCLLRLSVCDGGAL